MAKAFRLSGVVLILAVSLAVLANGDFLANLRKLWSKPGSSGQSGKESDSSSGSGRSGDEGVSGKSFSSKSGYYDGDQYMMSGASQRGWGWGGGGGGGGGGWGDDHQNLDLYSLLGGLSFASLLGATIIYLARRNTSGRRRRSADGLSYLEEDEIDFSEDPHTKGLNIVELLDTFLDNRHILFEDDSNSDNVTRVTLNHSRNSPTNNRPQSSLVRAFLPEKVHLGPGIVPHTLSDPVY